jgi:HEPN domain-containing protein
MGRKSSLNSRHMAESYLSEAEIRLQTAKDAVAAKHFSFAVRQSQECVELSLKGVLRSVGIEPPKWHDVGIVLRKESTRFPQWFRESVDQLSLISRQLAGERQRSMYGDSDLDLSSEELYTEFDAREAVRDAEVVHSICRKMVPR